MIDLTKAREELLGIIIETDAIQKTCNLDERSKKHIENIAKGAKIAKLHMDHVPRETNMARMKKETILKKTNDLAREFYSRMGYQVKKGYEFHKAHHPQEVMCYDLACLAMMELKGVCPPLADSRKNLADKIASLIIPKEEASLLLVRNNESGKEFAK